MSFINKMTQNDVNLVAHANLQKVLHHDTNYEDFFTKKTLLVNYIQELINRRGIEIIITADLDLMKQSIIDSLDLVEFFAYASDLFSFEGEYFYVNLRELTTINKINSFFYVQQPLFFDDFTYIFMLPENNLCDERSIITDLKIIALDALEFEKLKESVLASPIAKTSGIIEFWEGLRFLSSDSNQAEKCWESAMGKNPELITKCSIYRNILQTDINYFGQDNSESDCFEIVM